MKTMKKVLALALAAIMVMALAGTALAAKESDSGKGGSASITIKLPTDNAGTDDEITYTLYKVFDATNSDSGISYKIDSVNGDLTNDMKSAGFLVDDGGNVHYGTFTESATGTYVVDGKKGTITDKTELDDTALAAIAAYAKDKIGDYKAKPSDGTLKITNLEFGYYYISTTTGTVVTIDSTNPDATVNDKNTIPDVPDKSVTGIGTGSYDEEGQKALAQVGTTVSFSVEIVKVKGATNYVFHDVMDAGLAYNGDVAVTPADVVKNTTTASGDTITVTFDNDKLAALADGTKITINYSATVTSDALNEDPAKNTATLDYGDGHTTDSDVVEVYNAKFTVTKKDGTNTPLAGAGFVIANAEGKYYKYTAATGTASAKVEWVTSIDDATEYTSGEDGKLNGEFKGLANGTYTLIEKTVPAGYNKAADSTFTIAEKDYTATNLEQASTVTNNAGTELPSTGGIGTTIFYIVGAILVLGAGAVLVARRKASAK